MVVFEKQNGPHAHNEFQRWRQKHPTGLVLNRKTKSYGMIHLATCSHFGDMDTAEDAWGNLTRNAKICSTELEEVRRYAIDHGIEIVDCPDCKPG